MLLIGSFRSAGCKFTICLVFAEHVSSTTKHHIAYAMCGTFSRSVKVKARGGFYFIHKVKKTGMRLSFILQNYSYC